jgi:hypothetical protein
MESFFSSLKTERTASKTGEDAIRQTEPAENFPNYSSAGDGESPT